MNWISVKDRLPDDDGKYLVFWQFENQKYGCIETTQYDVKFDMWDSPKPTHWMPLPEPPEVDNEF